MLAHLAKLTATVALHPALLLMTSRVEGDPLDDAWRAEAASTPLTTIDLGPLPSEDARAFAETLIAANTAFAQRCVERAAGNPLFLDQLLRHADEGQAVAVPGSVQNLVQARIDRLDPADKEAAQAASVLGRGLPPAPWFTCLAKRITCPSASRHGSFCGLTRLAEMSSCSRMH
jgi:hypothetical protein